MENSISVRLYSSSSSTVEAGQKILRFHVFLVDYRLWILSTAEQKHPKNLKKQLLEKVYN